MSRALAPFAALPVPPALSAPPAGREAPPLAPGLHTAAATLVAGLRARFPELVRPLAPDAVQITGFQAIDRLLPDGGLPRGRLLQLSAPPGAGATSVLAALVRHTVARDHAVALLDATCTLRAGDWLTAHPERLLVVRPREPAAAPYAAHLLVSSGVFALVVLDGLPPPAPPVLARLRTAARQRGTAVVLAPGPLGDFTILSGCLRLRVESLPEAPDTLAVHLDKGARPATAVVSLAAADGAPPAARAGLYREPTAADRRGSRARGPDGPAPALAGRSKRHAADPRAAMLQVNAERAAAGQAALPPGRERPSRPTLFAPPRRPLS